MEIPYHLLLDAEIIPNKGADVVARVLLDFVPILCVVMLLLVERQPHENVVADLIAFAQRQAGGI